jgi:hypothetical protein
VRPASAPPTPAHGRVESEGVKKKKKKAIDQRTSEENSQGKAGYLKRPGGGDRPLPTSLAEQSQEFNKLFKPLEKKSGNWRRFV